MITKSIEKTKEYAKKVALKLNPGDILALVGDLGGGKTTFVKGLAEAFGIKEEIQSPTFTIIKEYKLSKKKKVEKNLGNLIKKFYHLDMYRIKSEKEASNLGLEELFQEKNAVFVIEWADRIKNILPPKTKWIEFDFINKNTRKIIIKL